MARWILFRDMGPLRRPCEVARCDAPDRRSARLRLAHFARGVEHISSSSMPTFARREPFFVQSAVSVQHDLGAARLRARPFVAPSTVLRPPTANKRGER